MGCTLEDGEEDGFREATMQAAITARFTIRSRHFHSTPPNPHRQVFDLRSINYDVHMQAHSPHGCDHYLMHRPLSNYEDYRPTSFELSSPLPESMTATARCRRGGDRRPLPPERYRVSDLQSADELSKRLADSLSSSSRRSRMCDLEPNWLYTLSVRIVRLRV
jgi:hypothetical protein